MKTTNLKTIPQSYESTKELLVKYLIILNEAVIEN